MPDGSFSNAPFPANVALTFASKDKMHSLPMVINDESANTTLELAAVNPVFNTGVISLFN
mgnify:CR=1 FL=1